MTLYSPAIAFKFAKSSLLPNGKKISIESDIPVALSRSDYAS